MDTMVVQAESERGEHHTEVTTPGSTGVAGLITDCDALLEMAEKAERLAGDIHKCRRIDEASLLAIDLRDGLERHLSEETAMLRDIRDDGSEKTGEAIERTLAEHAALRELSVPVLRGLRAVARNRLPTRLSRFVLSTTVLCEFLRLHRRFKCETLYPLLARPASRTRLKTAGTAG